MQNSNSIITIIVLVISGIVAIFLGSSIGSEDQQTPLMFITGVGLLALMFGMGKNLWMLLLLLWPLAGRIALLPVPFSVSNLAVMFVFAGALLMIPLGGFNFRGGLTFIDVMVLIITADIVLVFLMNPVGLSSLGSETVGSRPYFEIGIALLAYLVLRNQAMTGRQVRPLVTSILVLMTILSVGKTLSYYNPGIGFKLFPFYTDFVPKLETADPLAVNLVGASRQSILLDISQAIILVLIAFSSPMKALLPTRPIRFFLLLFAFAGILISGFRSLLLMSVAYIGIGAYIWGRFRSLAAVVMIGLTGFLAVYALNMVYPLPLSMQRAMSFLPGDWDPDAVQDSRGSSEWRFEMWREALFGHKLIENKVLGDGFGFSAQEMEVMENARLGNDVGTATHEHMMLVGGFHSGPISSIRFVGFVGLLIFTVFIVAMSVQVWKFIGQARGTPLFSMAIYFGVPIVFMPVFFFFIFGGYEGALPNSLFTAGVFLMLKNSLSDFLAAEKAKVQEPVAQAPAGRFALARSG